MTQSEIVVFCKRSFRVYVTILTGRTDRTALCPPLWSSKLLQYFPSKSSDLHRFPPLWRGEFRACFWMTQSDCSATSRATGSPRRLETAGVVSFFPSLFPLLVPWEWVTIAGAVGEPRCWAVGSCRSEAFQEALERGQFYRLGAGEASAPVWMNWGSPMELFMLAKKNNFLSKLLGTWSFPCKSSNLHLVASSSERNHRFLSTSVEDVCCSEDQEFLRLL